MNRDQFIAFVKSPSTLDAGSTTLLENLVKEYPFCQTAEILYALNLNKENNFRFNAQLKTAAAYAADRKLLKQLLADQQKDRQVDKKEYQTAEVQESIPDTDQISEPETVSMAEDVTDIPPAPDKKQELLDLIDRLKQEIESILTEGSGDEEDLLDDLTASLESIIPAKKKPEPPPVRPDIKDYNFSHLPPLVEKPGEPMSNSDLIDKFIRDEPRIEAPQKAEFFDAGDFAKHGLVDRGEIVSETLAKVHLKQGRTDDAIKIYEQLSLLYPEKSSFFAAQIKKIKRDQLTDR